MAWSSGTRSRRPARPALSHLIQAGPEHFVAVLEGSEAPILTAEHATHVLEIILAAGSVDAREGERWR